MVLCVEKEDALRRREEEQTPIGNQPEQRCSGQRAYRRGLCLYFLSGKFSFFPSTTVIHPMPISVGGEAPLLLSTLKRSWAFSVWPHNLYKAAASNVLVFGELPLSNPSRGVSPYSRTGYQILETHSDHSGTVPVPQRTMSSVQDSHVCVSLYMYAFIYVFIFLLQESHLPDRPAASGACTSSRPSCGERSSKGA